MRSLPAALSTAQKARVRTPHLLATVADRFAGIRRLRWTSWYSGSETDGPHAAAVPTDGSLNRLRIDSTTLYRSRVASPTSSSTYSSWTSVVAWAKLCALTAWGTNNINAYIVDVNNPTRVYESLSTDNGVSWSAFALVFTNPVDITHLAAAAKSNGDVVILVNSAAGAGHITAWRWNGSTWTDKGDSTTNLTLTGLAIHHAADYNVIATGTDADGSHVVQHIFGDGFSTAVDTWAAKVAIQDAIAASNIGFHSPYLYQPDVFRLSFRQAHTSAVTYDRIYQSRMPATGAFADFQWHEPVPFDLTAPNGAALSADANNVYLTTARRVYNAPLSEDTYDITADIISADLHEDPFSPRLSQIVLNNAAGTYTTPGTGAVAAITKGADVRVSPGYRTASGNLASLGPLWQIQGFRHTYEKGLATLTLTLRSVWTHLAQYRFPRAVTFAEFDKNIFQQLRYVITRSGAYEFSAVGGSSDSGNLQPPLAITPGTSALTAVLRILARVPDTLYTNGEFVFLNEPLAADSADATYKRPLSDGDQEINEALYTDQLKNSNHLQIFADDDASIVADEPDFAETDLMYSAPRQIHDPFLNTGAEATARADNEQRSQVVNTTRGDRIVAPVHCGLQTNDVIALTDARHNLTAAKRRVLSLHLIYRRTGSQARYDQVIELGAP